MYSFFRFGLRRSAYSFNKRQMTILQKLNISNSNSSENNLSTTFEQFIGIRRSEAERSIIVQVSSEKSFPELYNYCSVFGQIIGAHHYQISSDDLHYILIEFENQNIANEAINSSNYNEESYGVPVRSPFLWFKASNGNKKIKKITEIPQNYLKCIDGIKITPAQELKDLQQCSQNLNDQIQILYNVTKLNDLGIRLRFLAAKQIETSISGMFPFAKAIPFGSTVNGFGKIGCDLDLILRFDDNDTRKKDENSRLVFHTKENLTNGRSQIQRQMESISDMLQLFLPGVSQVRRILQARVPIIKYCHEHLNLEVDLSMSNLTGAYMSELLYMFGEFDNRVRPLTFCVRRWAQTVGLTNPSPGRWISNFSLTCLVIFFLQQLKNPILPPVNLLINSATVNDIRITEDGINCTFLRDSNHLNFKTENTNQLSELLLQFFEFYSQFDFHNRAISLNEGRNVSKPDHSAVYIINPLEQMLNVSKNISAEECERFRIEVRNAAWILESEIVNTLTDTEKLETSWGLLNLFRTPEQTIIRPNMFFRSRMVDVKDLFENNDQNSLNIDYKNESIRNQIRYIKNKTKSNIKQISLDGLDSNGKESSTTVTTSNTRKGRRR